MIQKNEEFAQSYPWTQIWDRCLGHFQLWSLWRVLWCLGGQQSPGGTWSLEMFSVIIKKIKNQEK